MLGHREATDVWMLILDPAKLLEVFVNSKSFSMKYLASFK